MHAFGKIAEKTGAYKEAGIDFHKDTSAD